MKLSKKRIILAIADILILLAGTVSAAVVAGMGIAPSDSYLDSVNVLSVIVLCFVLMILAVEIASAFKISDSTWHTVFIALSLLGVIAFSSDFCLRLREWGAKTNVQLFQCLNFAFFVLLAMTILNFWLYTYKLKLSKRVVIFASLLALCTTALYVGLSFVGLQIIGYATFAAEEVIAFVYIYMKLCRENSDDYSFCITKTIFFLANGAALANVLCNCHFIDMPSIGFDSFYAVMIIISFGIIYTSFAARTDQTALKAAQYRLQYERVKAETLRAQIKPHFIFNSLAAIQSLYHKSLEDGDRATSLFSRHLRANVEASNVDLIPFEQELDNIQVYIDLENMRYEPKFNVIFDIDETDFLIPVLSLQPYIENAVRYSKVNESGGYIKISTEKTDHGILLEIADNGVGFDVDHIAPTSCGIRNSRERFMMLLGVEPQITAAPGEGTKVSILIPSEGEKS